MTREEAKEILRNWDDCVWREQNHITMGDVSDALHRAEEALSIPWHKASEELPDCLTKVFVRYSNGEVSATYRTNHFIGETPDVKVTHWMPIPEIKED